MSSLIPLSVIAKELDIRTSRVQNKVHKLEISVHSLDEGDAIDQASTIRLLDSYIYSTKVSKATRDLARAFQKSLQTSEVSEDSESQNWLIRILNDGIAFMQSHHFKFLALIIAVLVQMQHSAVLFYRIAPDGSKHWWTAYSYAFMVDLFVLVVTMAGRLSIAKTFAWLTFIVNLLYFQCWINFDFTAQAYTLAVATTVISGIVAYILYAYAELFVQN